jgi:hypothetical protein
VKGGERLQAYPRITQIGADGAGRWLDVRGAGEQGRLVIRDWRWAGAGVMHAFGGMQVGCT